MSMQGLERWLESDQGRYVMAWEEATVSALVSDIFGFHALQVGLAQVDYLQSNRMPQRSRLAEAGRVDVRSSLLQLPFPQGSMDLVVLPHALEFSEDPHRLLREVERVLVPEGQLVLTAFNPYSLWGLWRYLHGGDAFPWNGRYLSPFRLHDWLKLLSFETCSNLSGCFAPPLTTAVWLNRFQGLEPGRPRWLPVGSGVYVMHAIKRIQGMRLVKPDWRKGRRRAKALAPVVQKERHDG